MTLQIIRYPTDPTGENPDNSVVGEVHQLNSRPVRVVAPTYGPYFTKSLVIYDNATNLVLIRGIHYQIAELLQSATVEFSQEVARLILIIDEKISPEVRINYQVVGGLYQNDASNLISLYESVLADDRPVDWINVSGKPDEYTPTLHNHVLQELYGFEYVVTALERIRNAIRLMRIPSLNSLDSSLNDRINSVSTVISYTESSGDETISDINYSLADHIGNLDNPHRVTKSQIGLGNVKNYQVATQLEAETADLNTRYMTPLRVKQAIDKTILVDLTTHSNNTNNPHKVTKNQVGLGFVQNFGLATQADAIAGISDSLYMTPIRVKELIASRIDTDLSSHSVRTDNPHGVTKSQIGLSSVYNYTLASQAEAEAGIANDRYMTPYRTKQAITYYFNPLLTVHAGLTNNPHNVTKSQVGLSKVENYPIASQAEAEAGVATDRYMTPLLAKQAYAQLQSINVSWNDIADKPTAFNPSAHTHAWTDIAGKPTLFTPIIHTHDWSTVTAKPSTYPPTAHNHDWSAITGKPSSFTPQDHYHTVEEINGISGLVSITIQGVSSMNAETTQTFIITNYDSFQTYNVSAISGTIISVVNDVITYKAPFNAGAGGFIVNGRQINVTITAPSPNTPSIVTPVNGSTDLAVNLTLTSSAFSIAAPSTAIHQSSDWQISTVSNFSSIVQQITDDTVNKTSWSVNGLNADTLYYVRVRYKANNGNYSAWSSVSSFRTRVNTVIPVGEQAVLGYDWINTGESVAIDDTGTRVVFTANENHGAYVFTRSGSSWILEASFTTTYPRDFFNVDISGDGTRFAIMYEDSGIYVNIYVRSGTTWTIEQSVSLIGIHSNLNYTLDNMLSISADGTRIIVGDPGKTSPITGQQWSGVAYILSRSGSSWTLEATIAPSDGGYNELFGMKVDIDKTGTRVVIGCPNDSQTVSFGGAVYVYIRSGTTWTLEAKILPNDLVANYLFGTNVSISDLGDRIAVNAPTVSNLAGSGGTYIFSRSGTTWTQEAKLTAADFTQTSLPNYNYGSSVVLNSTGDVVAVGGMDPGSGSFQQRAIFIFKRIGVTWISQTYFQKNPAYIAEEDLYGISVDISDSGQYMIVGDPFYGGMYSAATGPGAAIIYA